jgi:4,5-DOPA dioxygenase extradiol
LFKNKMATKLAALRERGVLVVVSGKRVRNHCMVVGDKLNVAGYGYNWAAIANESMKKHLRCSNQPILIDFNIQDQAMEPGILTPEHYLPLYYTLGMAQKG